MKNMKRSKLEKAFAVFLLAIMFVLPAGQARAANPIAATEITQLMNNAELVALLGEEAKQLAEIIKTYELMLEQAKMLPDLVKRNAINNLINLARNTQMGMAVSYASANIEDDLKKAYQGFADYEAFLKSATVDQRAARFQEVMQTTHDTVTATLKNAGLQAAMFEDESVAVEKIMNQMQTAQGQNEILQAAGSLAAANVEQQQKLRQLIMGQTNMLGAKIGAELDEKAKNEAGWKKFTTPHREIDPTPERMSWQEKLDRMLGN